MHHRLVVYPPILAWRPV